jgi:tRNA threonylcarbamoyladenosine dehydratase
VVDACDQVRAKLALAAWGLASAVPVVCVGAAGGKRAAQRVEVEDLADVTHDPLLAALRTRLRKEAGAARQGRIGLRCVFSRESVARPAALGEVMQADSSAACTAEPAAVDGSLNCQGYGSSVAVTATFGMVAAGEAVSLLLAGPDATQAGKAAKMLSII